MFFRLLVNYLNLIKTYCVVVADKICKKNADMWLKLVYLKKKVYGITIKGLRYQVCTKVFMIVCIYYLSNFYLFTIFMYNVMQADILPFGSKTKGNLSGRSY